ncbi:MAG TPA: MupA/Atu3671 family FMN-dependent luciferase-like monooxygenase, partial [Bryobacteraceae bacterium]|nr:MupA/Atu3671 family FMN-dependent luciferase-like monooxygenase [Bryobacteraceae bacterium]
FASGGGDAEGYRLLLEGAKFADRNGFEAVWTPERHFHAFGGIYPNPSVTSAAVAAVTSRVGIRAGSVVLPLHQPLRVAEEWSVVDNLSGGRVGISFASGWNHRDFVLAPDNYPNSKNLLFDNLEVVRRLWRGESIAFRDGKGNQSPVSVLPRPVQKELPVWITAAGNPETFRSAGKAGANLLTHLLGQKIEDLAAKIKVYRQAWKEAGHAGEGRVTLMLHSFVGPDADTVRETVRGPLTNYLKTSLDLIKNSPWSFPAFKNRPANSAELDLTQLSDEELQPILEYSFARYFETSGLFGTPDDAVRIAQNVSRIGVDEIACLIDFGIATQTVLDGLVHLNEVRQRCSQAAIASDDSLSGLMREHHVTHLQCTPSMARMMLTDRATKAALARLQKLLVGGEAITPALRDQLYSHLTGDLHNMYGPTETTVWSSTGKIDRFGPISLGSAIANTVLYIVDASMQPVPAGAEGELLIGGEGVARGYLKRPELTSERFIVDPLLPEARAYRTGDLVRLRQDGSLEFVGRLDHQIKIRGHRIELGDIENAMLSFSGVREAAALARDSANGPELNAYVVPVNGSPIDVPALKNHMKALLPEYMMPAAFVQMASFPMTANGKVDRKAFPAPDRSAPVSVAATDTSSYSEVQTTIATVWRDLLKL